MALFSYMNLGSLTHADHHLRKMRMLVDVVLVTIDATIAAVYAKRGRRRIPPEFLLRALLIQILYMARSERQLVKHLVI